MSKYIAFIIFVFITNTLIAQGTTQVIRGVVLDSESLSPIDSIRIFLEGSEKKNTISNRKGEFQILKVPIGRHCLRFQHPDYEVFKLDELVVTSGKEVLLKVKLTPIVKRLSEVIISADRLIPEEPLSRISRHTLDPKNSDKFAGALGDPSRMLVRFPGISNPDDTRNNLVVRGNSPVGVSWQIEGVSSINPNHFATAGNSGGGINLLNPYTLEKIDFYTGAFPAEFGNALSAVIDVSLRNGNSKKQELHLRTSLIDLDIGVEGPISAKKSSSYLISFRRFNLDIAHRLSTQLGSYLGNAPNVQDLTFKLNFPNERGFTSFYGLGGVSELKLRNSFESENQTVSQSRTAVSGLTNVYFINDNTFIKTNLAFSYAHTGNGTISEYRNNSLTTRTLEIEEVKAIGHIVLNKKIKAGNTVKMGIIGNLMEANNLRDIQNSADSISIQRNANLKYSQFQSYAEWKWRFLPRMQMKTGVHMIYLSLNQSFSLEPRFSFSWQISSKSSLSFALGKQSQIQPSALYLTGGTDQQGNPYFNNLDLGLSKSNQLVLSFQRISSSGFLFKAEGYYFHHYNIPDFKESTQPATFSGLNLGYDFGDDFHWISADIDNTGRGNSYGLEITSEKKFSNSLYLLVTGSIYNAKYQGFDRIERNTAFNGNFTYNIIFGKDFDLGGKRMSVFKTNLSITGAGGRRFTPVSLDTGIRDLNQIFDKKYKQYFRSDLEIGLQQNFKRFSHEISVDIRNVLNTKNILYMNYNIRDSKYDEYYQLGFLPLIIYQVNF